MSSGHGHQQMATRDGLVLPLFSTSSTSSNTSLPSPSLALLGLASTASNSASSAGPAAPTLTTPTLTPTTLRNIEQMFLDTECQSNEQHENAARFEPPSVSITFSEESNPNPNANLESGVLDSGVKHIKSEWIPDGSVLPGPHSNVQHELQIQQQLHEQQIGKDTTLQVISQALPNSLDIPVRLLPSEPLPPSSTFTSTSTSVGPYLMNNNNVIIATSNGVPNSINGVQDNALPLDLHQNLGQDLAMTAKRKGSTRKSSTSSTPADEEQRKILRRQRNKEAAARCRKRRLDQTLSLQEEVDQLEAQKTSIQEEIQKLESQKEELEDILNDHSKQCKAKVGHVVASKKPNIDNTS